MCTSRKTRWNVFLSRSRILEHIQSKTLRFDPPLHAVEDRVAQVSIDLLLGERFTVFKEDFPDHISAIRMEPSLWKSEDLWEDKDGASFVLHPGKFVLAQTLESVSMPNSLMGLIEGRSSYARLGISVHVTAPKIDPGFIGHITLEMANFGNARVELRAGIDKPAQLLLAPVHPPLKKSDEYGAHPTTDTFQYQTAPIPRTHS